MTSRSVRKVPAIALALMSITAAIADAQSFGTGMEIYDDVARATSWSWTTLPGSYINKVGTCYNYRTTYAQLFQPPALPWKYDNVYVARKNGGNVKALTVTYTAIAVAVNRDTYTPTGTPTVIGTATSAASSTSLIWQTIPVSYTAYDPILFIGVIATVCGSAASDLSYSVNFGASITDMSRRLFFVDSSTAATSTYAWTRTMKVGSTNVIAAAIRAHGALLSPNALPPAWNTAICPASHFKDGVTCHCGCGAFDPDCIDRHLPVSGCSDGQSCSMSGTCTTTSWPSTCNKNRYDRHDGCDCCSGTLDPDCNDPTQVAICNGKPNGGTCNMTTRKCSSNFDIWVGKEADLWDRSVCDCAVGGLDPDCANLNNPVRNCLDGVYCHKATSSLVSTCYYPRTWTCSLSWYGDNWCDCKNGISNNVQCGAYDIDCDTDTDPNHLCKSNQYCNSVGTCTTPSCNGVFEPKEIFPCDGGFMCNSTCSCAKPAVEYSPAQANCKACGNGILDAGEECDKGLGCGSSCTCNTGYFTTATLSTSCTRCGNSEINAEDGEECDGGSGCIANTCKCDAAHVPFATPQLGCDTRCGNGIAESAIGEQCDGGTGCTDCQCTALYYPKTPVDDGCLPRCGNKKIDDGTGEQCDGGFQCTTSCTCASSYVATVPPSVNCTKCGNGALDTDEQCDKGTGCASNCMCKPGFVSQGTVDCVSLCGNNQYDEGEECDGGFQCTDCKCNPGFAPTIPAATKDCRVECGNKKIEGTEQCDGGEWCDQYCKCSDPLHPAYPTPRVYCIGCGNAAIDTGEDCDGGAGCNSTCLCTGNTIPFDPATTSCTTCGNRQVDAGIEECDGGEFCNPNCTCMLGHFPESPVASFCSGCGNSVIDGDEQCDGGKGCLGCLCTDLYEPKATVDVDCQLKCGNGIINDGESCDSDVFCKNCRCLPGHDAYSPALSVCQGCKNGILDASLGEECDLGLGCNDNCTCGIKFTPNNAVACLPKCGNGAVNTEADEVCDGGLLCSNCACTGVATPYSPPRPYCKGCGNGVVDFDIGEQCEGNVASCIASSCTCANGFYFNNTLQACAEVVIPPYVSSSDPEVASSPAVAVSSPAVAMSSPVHATEAISSSPEPAIVSSPAASPSETTAASFSSTRGHAPSHGSNSHGTYKAVAPSSSHPKKPIDWKLPVIIVGSIVGAIIFIALLAGIVVGSKKLDAKRRREKLANSPIALEIVPKITPAVDVATTAEVATTAAATTEEPEEVEPEETKPEEAKTERVLFTPPTAEGATMVKDSRGNAMFILGKDPSGNLMYADAAGAPLVVEKQDDGSMVVIYNGK